MKVKFNKTFKFAKGGHTVITYLAGEEAEISERCFEVAKAAGAFGDSKLKKKEAPKTKDLGKAPENKSKESVK